MGEVKHTAPFSSYVKPEYVKLYTVFDIHNRAHM